MNTDETDIGLWVMTDNGYYIYSRYQTSTKINSIDLNRREKVINLKQKDFDDCQNFRKLQTCKNDLCP